MIKTKNIFWYKEFDIQAQLPDNWVDLIMNVALQNAVAKTLISSSITSREISKNEQIPVLTVGGHTINEELPWLNKLYTGLIRDKAQTFTSEPVSIAKNIKYAINLNIQKGSMMRYECHVDSNPIAALLYVTSHPPGTGGELVVSSDPSARGIKAIQQNATCIYPKSGTLVFFDGRHFPHYVAPLTNESDIRVVVAMNLYTDSAPETSRPADLSKHLGID